MRLEESLDDDDDEWVAALMRALSEDEADDDWEWKVAAARAQRAHAGPPAKPAVSPVIRLEPAARKGPPSIPPRPARASTSEPPPVPRRRSVSTESPVVPSPVRLPRAASEGAMPPAVAPMRRPAVTIPPRVESAKGEASRPRRMAAGTAPIEREGDVEIDLGFALDGE